MPAIAVQTKDSQVTIPMTSVSLVRRNADGTATVVLANGTEILTRDDYAKLSGRMTSVNVWGIVSTEQA